MSVAAATILVTGATSGIGLETARELARRGAHVLLGARDAERGREFADELSRAGGSAELLVIDMASFRSIRDAAASLTRSSRRVDVLVNNAGVAVRGRRLSPDGHELTWATNFLGPFLLTTLLLPLLRRSSDARVVNVASEAHRSGRLDWDDLELLRGYRAYRAYANSKLALVLFTRELARREPAVAANAIHPGAISTSIWRAAPQPFEWLIRLVLPSSAKGAAPVVRLAKDPALTGVSGRYFDRSREAEPSLGPAADADAARLWEIAKKATGCG